MNVDVLVIGAGIQGLILTKYLKEQGLNVKCVSNGPIGGIQTLQSQFYLHRGHFYDHSNLACTLNNTYKNWVSLIKELDLRSTADQSYIGFHTPSEEEHWLTLWKQAQLPYEKMLLLPTLLKESKGHSFYKFPHILFSGQQLIESLSNNLVSSLLVGNTTKIQEVNDELQEVFICHNDDMFQVKTKYIVLCAGIGNNALIETMTVSSKKIPPLQARSCLTLVLEGDLPDMSILLPGLKMFIAPQYHQGKIYWLYTYGVDLMATKEKKEIDAMRLKNQLHALFDFFPSLKKSDLNFHAYNSLKIENTTKDGLRPNQTFVHAVTSNTFLVWPTKLSLAFEASHEIYNHMKFSGEAKKDAFKKPMVQNKFTEKNFSASDIKVGHQKILTLTKKDQISLSSFL